MPSCQTRSRRTGTPKVPGTHALRGAVLVLIAATGGLTSVAVQAQGALADAGDSAVRIVVHPSNDVVNIPRDEVSDLLLGKAKAWPNGAAVVVVDQPNGSAVRNAFCEQVHGRSASSVTQSWTRAILAGKTTAPLQAKSDAEVLATVAENTGAIGYVTRESSLDGVRELRIVKRPRRVTFEEPKYTRMAERARLYGTVVLWLSVDEDGSVADVDVIQHLEMGLSKSAATAARSWRYEETRIDGRPVPLMLQETVRFKYFG